MHIRLPGFLGKKHRASSGVLPDLCHKGQTEPGKRSVSPVNTGYSSFLVQFTRLYPENLVTPSFYGQHIEYLNWESTVVKFLVQVHVTGLYQECSVKSNIKAWLHCTPSYWVPTQWTFKPVKVTGFYQECLSDK